MVSIEERPINRDRSQWQWSSSQWVLQSNSDTQYLLYDGHGSTRQTTDNGGQITESYSYDAYGVMLGGNPTTEDLPATNLLYTGEQFDVDSQMYYLRARYYDPLNGRFNQTDPFAGSPQDPQSLHKYLYCHANPVNVIDPSGAFTVGEFVTVVAIIAILGAILCPAMHAARERANERVAGINGTDAISFLGTGLQEQMDFDIAQASDPYAKQMNMAFWHKLGARNKEVTFSSALLEKRALDAIDRGFHAAQVADTGMGFAGVAVGGMGALFQTKVVWSLPHPPKGVEHWNTVVSNVTRRTATGEARVIYTNARLSTITDGVVDTVMLPDWAEVMPSGKLRIFEVVSPESQTYNELLKKGWRYRQILGERLEYYGVLNVGEVAQ